MKFKNQFLILIILLATLISCGPSQEENANLKINEGKQVLANGDTLKAIAILDSIKVLYPKAPMQIGVSTNIINELYCKLIDRKMDELALAETQIVQLEPNFLKEKTDYDKYTQYIHNSQQFSRSWKRSFLEVHLDERGEIYLSSNYMGKEQLNHTGIRIYDGTFQSQSEQVELNSQLNHQSDFNGLIWEKVSYMNGKADSVINFISTHPDLKLKCVFLGNRQYYILLENFDVKAVCDAYALSKAIKKQKILTDEIAQIRKKI